MKKCLFIVLALFGFNVFADIDMHTGVDHMSNMMGEDDDSGFMGSFSLRYKPMGFSEENIEDLTYRARIGWSGDINEAIQWAFALSTDTEQKFGDISVSSINFEQAYVSYSPIEDLSFTAGKFGWMPDFHKKGILYSEQLYFTGAFLKYNHATDDDMAKFYGKVAAYKLDDKHNKPLKGGVTLKGKLGGHYYFSEDMMAGLYVSGLFDGVHKGSDHTAKTLGQLGFHLSASTMPVPVGFFGVYLSDGEGLTQFRSYIAGLSVGDAGKADSTEMGDFGVAFNYYDINEEDYTVQWLNEDYVSGAGKGFAVRAQYNLYDNTNVVAKYAHNLAGGEDAHNLVGELMFVF